MYAGKLQTIRFRYTGKGVEAVLDRLPTAEIVETGETGCTIQAEVYGKGIVMWLLSQREYVEVLSPNDLREEMRDTLKKMLAAYAD